jgi:hypothetical protein
MTQFNHADALSVLFNLSLSSTDGRLIMNGDFYSKNINTAHISREVLFNYTIRENIIHLDSKSIIINKDDTMKKEWLPAYFADFFLRSHRGTDMFVQETETHALVFSENNLPLFYCNQEK